MTDIVDRLYSHPGPALTVTEQFRIMVEQRHEAAAEVERLTNAIRRIDGINDNPADYNPAINAVCDAILRPHLEPKP